MGVPRLFEMDGHKVLIVSPQDMSADGEFHNGNNVVFFTGDVDEEKHIFKYEKRYLWTVDLIFMHHRL